MFAHCDFPDASLPTMAALDRLRRRFALSAGTQDMYLAYEGTPQLSLCGILVTSKGDMDQLIAFCPLSKGVRRGSPGWRAEVQRQLGIASRIAERPESSRNAPDVIWLGYVGTGERAVPNWVYALACIPLTRSWNGELLSPRPFCPALFERMAGQPQAARWLQNRYPSPRTAAGGLSGPHAAPVVNR